MQDKDAPYVASVVPSEFVRIAPLLRDAPRGEFWSSYDRDADVLYLTFKRPAEATDSELTEDDVMIRYEGDEVIGLTILHASTR